MEIGILEKPTFENHLYADFSSHKYFCSRHPSAERYIGFGIGIKHHCGGWKLKSKFTRAFWGKTLNVRKFKRHFPLNRIIFNYNMKHQKFPIVNYCRPQDRHPSHSLRPTDSTKDFLITMVTISAIIFNPLIKDDAADHGAQHPTDDDYEANSSWKLRRVRLSEVKERKYLDK